MVKNKTTDKHLIKTAIKELCKGGKGNQSTVGLLLQLQKNGIITNRSMVWRIMRDLKLEKQDGRYLLPNSVNESDTVKRHRNLLQAGLLSVGNELFWLPIKTANGYAEGIGHSLQQIYKGTVHGTVAGSNFVALAFTNEKDRDEIRMELKKIIKKRKTPVETEVQNIQ